MIKPAAFLCLLLLFSSPAPAAEPGSDPLQVYFQKGIESLRTNDLQGAIEAVQKIKQTSPEDIRGYFLAVQVLWRLQKLPDMIWEIERAEKSGIQDFGLYRQKILGLFLIDSFMATYDALDDLENFLKTAGRKP